ncbi:TPA: RNA 3'-terminal phosphate cyclase [Candidatus Woesearchaeota archaeon]|nr:RNA 3'-terminal phosphate cyclase [Candidatus Woesearchaeota archaeon]
MLGIDGSYLEGGGQILRTSLALSCLTLQSFEIINIRKGRPNPGLQPQHLACIKALEEFCNASSEGAEVGSQRVVFCPGKPQSRPLSVDIGTAGSVTLLLQALLLPTLFAPGKVRFKLTGGTNVSYSPPVEYFSAVLLPQLSRFAKFECSLLNCGYFPKGNGRLELGIKPVFHLDSYDNFADFQKAVSLELPPIAISERGRILKVSGISHASSDLRKADVAERQARAAKSALLLQFNKLGINCPISIQSEYSAALSTGSGISLFAHFAAIGKDEPDGFHPVILGSDALGERSKRAEEVGQEAAAGLIKEIISGACVDHYLADQLVQFLAITGGKIQTSEITSHCRTNVFTVQQFLGSRFAIDEEKKAVSVI